MQLKCLALVTQCTKGEGTADGNPSPDPCGGPGAMVPSEKFPKRSFKAQEVQGSSVEMKQEKPQVSKGNENCVKPFTAPKTCSASIRRSAMRTPTSLSQKAKEMLQLLGADVGQLI